MKQTNARQKKITVDEEPTSAVFLDDDEDSKLQQKRPESKQKDKLSP